VNPEVSEVTPAVSDVVYQAAQKMNFSSVTAFLEEMARRESVPEHVAAAYIKSYEHSVADGDDIPPNREAYVPYFVCGALQELGLKKPSADQVQVKPRGCSAPKPEVVKTRQSRRQKRLIERTRQRHQ
jgi:hypothetical protein